MQSFETFDDKLATMDVNGAIIQDSKKIKVLERKLVSLEVDLKLPRSKTKAASLNTIEDNKKQEIQGKSCQTCSKSFTRNCDLENHIESHQLEKDFECDLCDNRFFLNGDLENTDKFIMENQNSVIISIMENLVLLKALVVNFPM